MRSPALNWPSLISAWKSSKTMRATVKSLTIYLHNKLFSKTVTPRFSRHLSLMTNLRQAGMSANCALCSAV